MRKGVCALWLCIILAILLAVPAAAADTATLTITPDKTALTADGAAQQITYTVTVTPPPGKEIGVFSFRLKPSGDMQLPTAFKEGDQRVITYESPDLEYNINTDSGVFRTYEYTPESRFFAAVGSLAEKRMKDEAKILTITATVPAGSSGAYVLDAEFTAAPDGSGESYIARVDTAPVMVTAPDAASEKDGGGKKAGSVMITGLPAPAAGQQPGTEAQVTAELPVPPEITVTWYCDGAELTDQVFLPGHVYTVVLRVTAVEGGFDPAVYTNGGYTLRRISDTELELRRSFSVEESYTRPLEEAEASPVPEALPPRETDSREETAAAAPAASGAARPADKTPAVLAACLLGALALAAAICQFALPGGLVKLCSKNKHRNKERTKEESH